MIRAGALLYSVVVSLIIAMICTSLILYSYLTGSLHIQAFTGEMAMTNARSGINLLLIESIQLAYGVPETVELFEEGGVEVELQLKPWGVFDIGISKAESGISIATKAALLGGKQDDEKPYAIYLSDNPNTLSVCGKTEIKGDCYLPKSAVKRGYIEGKSFEGTQLIQGQIHQSNRLLPEISQKTMYRLNEYLNFVVFESGKVNDLNKVRDSLFVSFTEEPKMFFSDESVEINNLTLRGHIIIGSSQKITIDPSSNLKDIILIAPSIEIKNGFEGSLQAFATHRIVVGQHAALKYPSVLAITAKQSTKEDSEILIEEKCDIRGVLLAFNEKSQRGSLPLISIGTDTKFTGQVYSKGYVELKGNVHGSIACRQFLLRTSSSVYENNLLDATINRTLLPLEFAGLRFANYSINKRIAKWVN